MPRFPQLPPASHKETVEQAMKRLGMTKQPTSPPAPPKKGN